MISLLEQNSLKLALLESRTFSIRQDCAKAIKQSLILLLTLLCTKEQF